MRQALKAISRPPPRAAAGRRRPSLPMSQKVYQALRRKLMAGGFRPGEGVSLRTLASQLGTSAMPVREAVHRLIAEQALQLLPNRQIIVPRMTRRKFAELSTLRQTLEGMAAAAAVKVITDEQVEHLQHLNEVLVQAIPGEDTGLTLERNKDFHFALYECAGTDILMTVIEGLWTQAGPFLNLSLSEQKWSWTNTQHEVILRGLRARNAETVTKAIEQDIADTAELLQEIGVFDD